MYQTFTLHLEVLGSHDGIGSYVDKTTKNIWIKYHRDCTSYSITLIVQGCHRKPLKQIDGKTVIQRVVDHCMETHIPTYVVTDSLEINDQLYGPNVIFQDKKAESGTERIVNALDHIDADNIINVQGDQPFILTQGNP